MTVEVSTVETKKSIQMEQTKITVQKKARSNKVQKCALQKESNVVDP
jgi:hypothetical protein